MPTSRRAFLLACLAAGAAGCAQAHRSTASPRATSPTAPARPSTRPTSTAVTPAPTARATAPAGPAPEIDAGPRTGNRVALTFHGSGSPELTDRLLTEAEQAGVTVTVLAVGTWLRQHPELAARVLRGGHELGNHTMTHPVLHRLSRAQVAAEIGECRALLLRLTGTPGAWFRPSGGSGSTALIRAETARAGYPELLGFGVDPRDYADPGADAVVARTLAAVRPGSIVSLHLGHAGTVSALPRLLEGMRGKGLVPGTATQLLVP